LFSSDNELEVDQLFEFPEVFNDSVSRAYAVIRVDSEESGGTIDDPGKEHEGFVDSDSNARVIANEVEIHTSEPRAIPCSGNLAGPSAGPDIWTTLLVKPSYTESVHGQVSSGTTTSDSSVRYKRCETEGTRETGGETSFNYYRYGVPNRIEGISTIGTRSGVLLTAEGAIDQESEQFSCD
jgi:hypothetical protein